MPTKTRVSILEGMWRNEWHELFRLCVHLRCSNEYLGRSALYAYGIWS